MTTESDNTSTESDPSPEDDGVQLKATDDWRVSPWKRWRQQIALAIAAASSLAVAWLLFAIVGITESTYWVIVVYAFTATFIAVHVGGQQRSSFEQRRAISLIVVGALFVALELGVEDAVGDVGTVLKWILATIAALLILNEVRKRIFSPSPHPVRGGLHTQMAANDGPPQHVGKAVDSWLPTIRAGVPNTIVFQLEPSDHMGERDLQLSFHFQLRRDASDEWEKVHPETPRFGVEVLPGGSGQATVTLPVAPFAVDVGIFETRWSAVLEHKDRSGNSNRLRRSTADVMLPTTTSIGPAGSSDHPMRIHDVPGLAEARPTPGSAELPQGTLAWTSSSIDLDGVSLIDDVKSMQPGRGRVEDQDVLVLRVRRARLTKPKPGESNDLQLMTHADAPALDGLPHTSPDGCVLLTEPGALVGLLGALTAQGVATSSWSSSATRQRESTPVLAPPTMSELLKLAADGQTAQQMALDGSAIAMKQVPLSSSARHRAFATTTTSIPLLVVLVVYSVMVWDTNAGSTFAYWVLAQLTIAAISIAAWFGLRAYWRRKLRAPLARVTGCITRPGVPRTVHIECKTDPSTLAPRLCWHAKQGTRSNGKQVSELTARTTGFKNKRWQAKIDFEVPLQALPSLNLETVQPQATIEWFIDLGTQTQIAVPVWVLPVSPSV